MCLKMRWNRNFFWLWWYAMNCNKIAAQTNWIVSFMFSLNSFTFSLYCLSTPGTLSQISNTSNAIVHLLHLIFDYKIEENVKCQNNTQFEMANNSRSKFKSWNFYNRFHFLAFYWHCRIRETNLMCIWSIKRIEKMHAISTNGTTKHPSHKSVQKRKRNMNKIAKNTVFCWKTNIRISIRLLLRNRSLGEMYRNVIGFECRTFPFRQTPFHFLNSVFVIRFESQWANCEKCTLHAQSTG